MISLSRIFGKENGRAVKKVLFLFTLLVFAYVVASVVFFSVMIYRWASIADAQLFGGDLSNNNLTWLFILIVQSPWLIWIISHAVYKYTSLKRERDDLRNKRHWIEDKLELEGIKSVLNMDSKIVTNYGTSMDDNDRGYELMDQKDIDVLNIIEQGIHGANGRGK